MRKLVLIAAMATIALPPHVHGGDMSLSGTYRLVSEQRTIVDTGEVIPGTGSRGYISYDPDGRMMVGIVRNPRPKPEGPEKMTDQQRVDLFRTLTAYAGTYTFDGTNVEHSIEISMKEIWSGTKQVRSGAKGRRSSGLHNTPVPFHTDGKMSVNSLVWEKVK
jgi:hypothetical protein